MKRALLIVFGPLTVVLAVAISIATLGYLNLDFDIDSEGARGVSPRLDTSPEAIARASAVLRLGDRAGAASEVVEGLGFQVIVTVTNNSPVPVLVPSTEHAMLVDDVAVTEPAVVEVGVLSPGETGSFAVDMSLMGDQVPGVVFEALFDGGSIDYVVRSRLKGGVFSGLAHESSDTLDLPGIVRALLEGRDSG